MFYIWLLVIVVCSALSCYLFVSWGLGVNARLDKLEQYSKESSDD